MRIWANKSDHLMRIDKPFLNLIIIDQELKNTLGHHYEYDRSVLKAAKESGIKGMILGSLNVESNIKGELGVLPVFSQPMWISHGGSHTSSLKLNLIYFIDLAKSFIFKGIFLKRHKLLFVHSVNADQLFGLMLFSLFFGFFYKKLAIVLRYQNEVYLNPLSHLALRVFEKLSKELASDELVFKEIDVENDEEGYTEDFGIRNIPTFLISNEHGEELGRLVGSKPEEELRKFILETSNN
jgi:thiol-disulfide isomerase/thioredoxin